MLIRRPAVGPLTGARMPTHYRTHRQRLLAALKLDVTVIGPSDGVPVVVGPTHPEARPISLMRNGLITASSLGK
jgi:hypothetical protein